MRYGRLIGLACAVLPALTGCGLGLVISAFDSTTLHLRERTHAMYASYREGGEAAAAGDYTTAATAYARAAEQAERLWDLAWEDCVNFQRGSGLTAYDKAKLSAGLGVHPRTVLEQFNAEKYAFTCLQAQHDRGAATIKTITTRSPEEARLAAQRLRAIYYEALAMALAGRAEAGKAYEQAGRHREAADEYRMGWQWILETARAYHELDGGLSCDGRIPTWTALAGAARLAAREDAVRPPTAEPGTPPASPPLTLMERIWSFINWKYMADRRRAVDRLDRTKDTARRRELAEAEAGMRGQLDRALLDETRQRGIAAIQLACQAVPGAAQIYTEQRLGRLLSYAPVWP